VKKSLIALATASALFSGVVQAKESQLPQPMQMIVDSGAAEVVKTFDTERDDIQGYVIKQANGKHTIVYGLDNYAFAGVLLNEKGENLTNRYAALHVPEPDLTDVAQKIMASEYLVTEGKKGAPEIYVFTDPNCPYCAKFFEMSRSYVKAGKVRIHWVPVGFLSPTSKGIAAAIIQGGIEVMAEAKRAEKGQSKPSIKPSRDVARALAMHQKYMDEAGIGGTPGFVYKVNGEWKSQSGVPPKAKFEEMLSEKTNG